MKQAKNMRPTNSLHHDFGQNRRRLTERLHIGIQRHGGALQERSAVVYKPAWEMGYFKRLKS